MSDPSFRGYGASGPMPQQPKFKGCVWDSENLKDPSATFRTSLCIFGGVVANY